MVPFPSRSSTLAFLASQRTALAISVVAILASAGTAAAVSYLVLGSMNTASATTTLKSGTDGAVLQLTNTYTGHGTDARGLAITVPAGRPPMTVNSAVKVTNLNADKLDGSSSSAFARGTNVSTLANRIVLANGEIAINLLTLPGLGELKGYCGFGAADSAIKWLNSTPAPIDMWYDLPGDGLDDALHAHIVPAGTSYEVTLWDPTTPGSQGHVLLLGQGNDPGPRRTATVIMAAFRTSSGAPCGIQATATLWSTP